MMPFKTGGVYTNANMLGVCMLVTSIEDENRVGVRLQVRWFKRNGLDLNAKDNVVILARDYERWAPCSNE